MHGLEMPGVLYFRPSFVRNRRSKDDVLSRFPVSRGRHAVFSRKLQGIDDPQHLIEISSGGHRIGNHKLYPLVRTNDVDVANSLIVRGCPPFRAARPYQSRTDGLLPLSLPDHLQATEAAGID